MPEGRGNIHGIDEAGYGPLLGPLVVARADLEGARLGSPRLRARARGRIGDSKAVLRGARGLPRLEATALAVGEIATGRRVESLEDWLRLDGREELASSLDELPWYRDRDLALPLAASRDEVGALVEGLLGGAFLAGARPVGLRLRLMVESRYNASLESTANKHETLFGEVAALIDEVAAGGGDRLVTVDRLGGRTRYGEKLAATFPFVPIEVRNEGRAGSDYACGFPDGTVALGFRTRADADSPEVSIASMAAKYTRELLMTVFNRHWLGRFPGVRPTAGYWSDGRRFLADLERAGGVAAEDLSRLVRRR